MKIAKVKEFLESITDRHTLKRQGFIPVRQFGKDHWSTLAYVGCRCVDNEGFLHGPHLRVHPSKVGIERAYGQSNRAWNPEHGTRLHGFFLDGGGVNKKCLLPEHDDIDCLHDMEAAGLVIMGTDVSLFVQLTATGQEFEQALRVHKQDAAVLLISRILRRSSNSCRSTVAKSCGKRGLI